MLGFFWIQLAIMFLMAVNLYCLIDAIRRPDDMYRSGHSKTLWITLLIISFVIPIGLVIATPGYLISARRRAPAS